VHTASVLWGRLDGGERPRTAATGADSRVSQLPARSSKRLLEEKKELLKPLATIGISQQHSQRHLFSSCREVFKACPTNSHNRDSLHTAGSTAARPAAAAHWRRGCQQRHRHHSAHTPPVVVQGKWYKAVVVFTGSMLMMPHQRAC
jgi:hypothetical protein